MTVSPILATADWRMSWVFVATVVLLVSLMKAASLLCCRQQPRSPLFFLLSPLASVDSLRRVGAVASGDVRQTFARCGLMVGAFLFAHWTYWRLVTALD